MACRSTDAEGDAGLRRVVGGHFKLDLVADDEPDEALAHFTRDVGEKFVPVRQFDFEHGSCQHCGNHAFEFDLVFCACFLGVLFGVAVVDESSGAILAAIILPAGSSASVTAGSRSSVAAGSCAAVTGRGRGGGCGSTAVACRGRTAVGSGRCRTIGGIGTSIVGR